MKKLLSFALVAFAAQHAHGDPAQIEDVTAQLTSAGWTFSVTLRHGDTGWDDYADGWRVVAPDGTVLGTRVLLHPHETEQPFTRSLSGVQIPDHITQVRIEARTLPEGWTSAPVVFTLPR